jgi:putative ABC transport system permease protein
MVLRTLDRLLIRTVGATRSQFAAAVLTILVGLMIFVAMRSTYYNMETALSEYYRRYGFAHLFADMNPSPETITRDVASLPGVTRAEGRLIFDARVETSPGVRATVRVVSYPVDHRINDLYIISGSLPDPEGGVGLALLKQYADTNNLAPGDPITLFVQGEPVRATVTGVVESPEFVYAIKDARDMFPDFERFGIAFMPLGTAQNLLGMEGRINNLVATVDDEAKAADLRKSIEEDWSDLGMRVTERENQLSHAVTTEELNSIEQFSTLLPAMFLGIGVVVVYLMLSRMVEAERIPIGIMMALGYSKAAIIAHYVKYSVLIGLTGALAGIISGYLLSLLMLPLFTQFYRIPLMQASPRPGLYLAGIVASCLVAGSAGFLAALKTTRISPTEAMRPPVPQVGRAIFLEALPVVWRHLASTSKMMLRSLIRNRQRLAFAILGIGLTYACILVPLHSTSIFTSLLEKQFGELEAYDYSVSLTSPAGYGVLAEVASAAGASRVEPYAEQYVKINYGWKEEFALARAIPVDTELFRLEDAGGRSLLIPTHGILIPEYLAGRLDVSPGSVLRITSFTNPDRERDVPVIGIVRQYLGSTAYMSLEQMEEILGEKEILTGVAVKTHQDPRLSLDDVPRVEVVHSPADLIESYRSLMEMGIYSLSVMVLLGCVFGFATLFSTASISLSERLREFSTLRVLGFSKAEVFSIVLKENLTALLGGVVLGVPLGHLLWVLLARSFSTDLYYLPQDALFWPHIWTLGITLGFFGSVMVAMWLKVRKVRFLDALKIRIT